MTILKEAINLALAGKSNDDCVEMLATQLVSIKDNSDLFTERLSMLIGAFLWQVQPTREFKMSLESDRLLLKFAPLSAALRVIRREKRHADEFAAALDAAGIPRNEAFKLLSDCKYVLRESV